MPITLTELESFHRFAAMKLKNGGAESIAELAHEWQASRERDEVNQALRDATEDLKAGRHRPAGDVMRNFERKYNLPSS